MEEMLSGEIEQVLAQYVHIQQCDGDQMGIKAMWGKILLNPKCTEMERITLPNAIAERFSVTLYTESDTSKLHRVDTGII